MSVDRPLSVLVALLLMAAAPLSAASLQSRVEEAVRSLRGTMGVAAQNLEAFQKGTSNNAGFLINMASATAESPTKLVIKLKQPDPAFLTYLGQAAGSQDALVHAIPPHALPQPTTGEPTGGGPAVRGTGRTPSGQA